MSLPANLPSIANAKLPVLYEEAHAALAKCQKVDECRDWANKAEALASYAKQAKNHELRKMAERIQARAIRRCGALLREIEDGQGARSDLLGAGADPKLSRAQAARDAGMSRHQKRTALRVANVPEDEFEALVESDDPPTVTALSEKGTRPITDLEGRDPDEYLQTTYALGMLRHCAEFAEEHDPAAIARGALPSEHVKMAALIDTIHPWITRLRKEIA